MWLISYHRAGVAKRQARAALGASRRLRGAVEDIRDQNEQLVDVVERQAATIEQLELELGELRARLENG
jgi:predicted RNase H-like nuclease (RuvC/YqgF family)